MVERLRRHYHIRDERVLAAMGRIPRHLFVPEALQSHAYGDHALPIEFNQTISQPYIVARQTELLEVTKDDRALEIGAGSGYQTAVLAAVAGQVFALERIPELAREAQARLGVWAYTTPRSNASTAHMAGTNSRPIAQSWSPPPRQRLRNPSSINWRSAAIWLSPSEPKPSSA